MSALLPIEPIQLGEETLTAIQPVEYPAGTILFRPGDPDDKLYLVLSGQIALIADPDTEQESIAMLCNAGEQTGERSILEPGHIHRLAGRVTQDAQLLVLEHDNIDMVLRREPLLAYRLIAIASHFLHNAHKHAQHKLEKKNQELSAAYTALEQAQSRLLAQERLQHELSLARDIQERMLPATLPQTAQLDIAARIIPAFEVSGDFYDVFRLDEQALGFVIADVCGKGMPAALYMAQTRTLIRAHALPFESPDSILQHVNMHLHELYSGDMFVTLVYGILHEPSRTLMIARAGHEYPLIWTQGEPSWAGIPATGQPLGLLDNPIFDVQMWTLAHNDVLVLYTDGITEAQSPDGNYFGSEKLSIAVAQSHHSSADTICNTIIEAVSQFQSQAAQHDDITLLVLKMRAPE